VRQAVIVAAVLMAALFFPATAQARYGAHSWHKTWHKVYSAYRVYRVQRQVRYHSRSHYMKIYAQHRYHVRHDWSSRRFRHMVFTSYRHYHNRFVQNKFVFSTRTDPPGLFAFGQQLQEGFAAPNRMTSRVIQIASRYIGHGNVTGFRGAWCKYFTNKVLREAGFHPSPSGMAIDGLLDGQRVRNPQPGDLAVMRSHITFFAGYGGRGFIGIGGNQGGHYGHRDVTVSSYSFNRVVAFVRPI
jgi:hypothetical protein